MQNNTDQIYHHGVLGQKWGVRRYQNKDGSLTSAGRKRAAKLEEKYQKVTGKKIGEQSKQKIVKKKTAKEMTDDELRNKTNRLMLENNYDTQVARMNQLHPEKVSKGKAFVKKVWNDVIVPGSMEVGKEQYKRLVTNAIEGNSKKK